ncbi:MAG: hypothetical protein PHU12_02840 [Candidatus Aenigmarchaeota archaeon]|nr:hypothetical protein [Candidatus Aenigmarchaeota archaeon]
METTKIILNNWKKVHPGLKRLDYKPNQKDFIFYNKLFEQIKKSYDDIGTKFLYEEMESLQRCPNNDFEEFFEVIKWLKGHTFDQLDNFPITNIRDLTNKKYVLDYPEEEKNSILNNYTDTHEYHALDTLACFARNIADILDEFANEDVLSEHKPICNVFTSSSINRSNKCADASYDRIARQNIANESGTILGTFVYPLRTYAVYLKNDIVGNLLESVINNQRNLRCIPTDRIKELKQIMKLQPKKTSYLPCVGSV